MKLLNRIFGSSLGKKFVVAITGMALWGFVLVHMLGNLQIFLGAETLNAYAKFLRVSPELLWAFRIGLLLMVVLHVFCAVLLTKENRAARPMPYKNIKLLKTSYASRTMAISGAVVFLFVVYHLMHFTWGVTNPDLFHLTDSQGRHDVYNMVVRSYQIPYIAVLYVLCVGLLCIHLQHGLSSMFHSLGFVNQAYTSVIESFAKIFAWVIFIGMSVVPIAVLLGFVKQITL